MSTLQFQILAVAVWGFWAGCLGLALRRGDRPVRLFAATALTFFLLARIARWLWHGPAVWSTWADAAILVPMLAIALRWPRRWLVWACAFQLATVATYVAHALDRSIGALAYATAVNLWGVLGQCALLYGTFEADRWRRARRGTLVGVP
ncbi:hypothetical protein [Caulobacter sp. 17J80-11]|uniref:hypothetical protein n=1 Tax=Caulobacter sp. 17J80-11 TaxID=2763502 RepID=UPI0016538327|nr:hypothetical protein [Caulobacter sp. 17J80-11]MBC6980164.1 hypothetical protein [Caulobacter sp. 17J80-11]